MTRQRMDAVSWGERESAVFGTGLWVLVAHPQAQVPVWVLAEPGPAVRHTGLCCCLSLVSLCFLSSGLLGVIT